MLSPATRYSLLATAWILVSACSAIAQQAVRVDNTTKILTDPSIAVFTGSNGIPTLTGTQTLSNKTLTNVVISSGSISAGVTGLTASSLASGTISGATTISGTWTGNITRSGTTTGSTFSGATLTGSNVLSGSITATGTGIKLDLSGTGQSIKITKSYMPITTQSGDSGYLFGDDTNATGLSFRGSSSELFVSGQRFVVLPDPGFTGQGSFQIGNNGGTSEIIFVSKEGEATSTLTTIGSHRFLFKSGYWTGSASQVLYSGIQANADTSGNAYLDFYTPMNAAAGTLTGGRYIFSSGTSILRIGPTGTDFQGFAALNIGNVTFSGTGASAMRSALSLGTSATTAASSYVAATSGTASFLTATGTGATINALTVTGSASTTLFPLTINQTASAGTAEIKFQRAGTDGWGIQHKTSGNLLFYDYGRSAAAITLAQSGNAILMSGGGNVLVGTASDHGERFQVSGASYFAGNVTTTGTFIFSGTATAPSGTSAPVSWVTIQSGTATYKLPLYQ